jgi:hypothetical protein
MAMNKANLNLSVNSLVACLFCMISVTCYTKGRSNSISESLKPHRAISLNLLHYLCDLLLLSMLVLIQIQQG